MILEFHPAAELELIEVSVYYEGAVPGLGNGSRQKFEGRPIFSWILQKSVRPSRFNNANSF